MRTYNDGTSTLVMVLDDGTHRTTTWSHRVDERCAREELGRQQRSRLHQVVAATLFVCHDLPVELLPRLDAPAAARAMF